MSHVDVEREPDATWITPDWGTPGIGAFVTTRRAAARLEFGFDAGPARLDALDSAARAHVEACRRAIEARLPGPPVWLDQAHGREVVAIDASNLAAARSLPPRADAAVTRVEGVALAVRAADCLPVLFADRELEVVGAAHAGWRGLACGVLENTVDAMRIDPGRVRAWIGPGIGPKAFEVGTDVVDTFARADADSMRHFASLPNGKWLADLPALARQRLARRGVSEVSGGDICTFSDPIRFPSWRRDRTRERMAAVIWLA